MMFIVYYDIGTDSFCVSAIGNPSKTVSTRAIGELKIADNEKIQSVLKLLREIVND